jgi:hypothetical protein
MKRSILISESAIQKAIVEWANIQPFAFGKVGDFLIAIKNEGKQKIFKNKDGKNYCPTGQRYNKEGRKKGVSDLFLALPKIDQNQNIVLCGLWREIKAKGKKPTKEQTAWLMLMRLAGYDADWSDDSEVVINDIKDYLGMK